MQNSITFKVQDGELLGTCMSAGYYKIELRPEQKSSVCPVCATVNNHIATASNYAHVAKITARRVVLYYRNFDSKFDPRVTA